MFFSCSFFNYFGKLIHYQGEHKYLEVVWYKQGVFLSVKWATERQKIRQEDRFFFTFSAQFPLLFPPRRPLSVECAEYAFHRQAVKSAIGKKKQERGRRKERTLLPCCTTMSKDGVTIQKTSSPSFFHFSTLTSRNTATFITRFLGPHLGYPLWRWGKKSCCKVCLS